LALVGRARCGPGAAIGSNGLRGGLDRPLGNGDQMPPQRIAVSRFGHARMRVKLLGHRFQQLVVGRIEEQLEWFGPHCCYDDPIERKIERFVLQLRCQQCCRLLLDEFVDGGKCVAMLTDGAEQPVAVDDNVHVSASNSSSLSATICSPRRPGYFCWNVTVLPSTAPIPIAAGIAGVSSMVVSNTLKIAPALPAFARIRSSKVLCTLTSSFFLLVRLKMRDFLPRACVRVKRTRGLRAATGCGRFGPMVARKDSSPRFERKSGIVGTITMSASPIAAAVKGEMPGAQSMSTYP